jgi:hypothetical protein
MIFLGQNAIDQAASVIPPLDAGSPLAGAAEAESLFGRTALARRIDERGIDYDTLLRERD